MSQRSPYNDRNKVEQKGKTRKSAAASKPKRGAGVAASAAPSKKKKKAPARKSFWSRGPARQPVAPQVQTPEMKRLRRIWWILWGSSLGVALVAVFIGQFAKTNPSLQVVYTVLLGLWAASFAGVIYLEIGPIRKARRAALEEAKLPKGKKQKAAKANAAKAAAMDAVDAASAADEAAGKDEDA
jgi:hypothetical protein